MKKFCTLLILMFSFCLAIAQQENLLDFDQCKDEVSKKLQNKYDKAVDYFYKRKYQQASLLLTEIIKENEDFASPYFLMGMIGVSKDNTKMIMKYFPLVKEKCPEFSHPLLYYYMGQIDYTEERYKEASADFEKFLTLTDQDNRYDSLQNIAINYIDWSDFLKQTMSNKVKFEPKKISFLAKNKNYFEPFITWDKNEIYFIREEIKRDTNYDSFTSEISTTTNRYLERSILDSTGFYDRGFILDEPFNTSFPLSGVSVTADNNYLFFSVKNSTKDNNTWDIYYCERIEDYFSNAKPLNINTEAYDEFSPSISADGNTLYFVSNRQGSKGMYDIWRSKRTGKDTWSEAENLGRNVNTFGSETYPFIASDNKHLYFLSNGKKTLGGSDIFVYDIEKDTPAENIGYPINTESNERPIGVCLDGKTAYSTIKNADNKYYEINLFDLDDRCVAEKRILINGKMNKQLYGDVSLTLMCVNDNKTTSYYISDSHPNFTFVIEENKDYVCFLDQKGYMFYATKVNSKTTDLVVNQTPLQAGMSMDLEGISFDESGINFDEISQLVLDNFVSFLQSSALLRIDIKANKKMGEALRNYLLKSGIREDRLSFTNSNKDVITYTIK